MNRRTLLTSAAVRVAILFGFLTLAIAGKATAASQEVSVLESLDIGEVPAEFPVGFCLLTKEDRQYVAYYDAQHRMTVAARKLGAKKWQYQVLPSNVGWDSHNYITMAIDDDGHIHLSGNMHCVPLVYFRTQTPWDITTFEKITAMTGTNENRCTYPQFMRSSDNRLLFHYRDGRSGNGCEIYNIYDSATKSWKRFLDKPLTDGNGRMNAYMSGPALGPDGWFHLCWVWRDTPDCRSNHSPSYARSRDMKHWETIDGKPVPLPITPDNKDTLVDLVPAGGGIINGALNVGFDSESTPLLTYIKFDESGKTQIYLARYQSGHWNSHQVTKWDYRWDFKGGGTIVFEIHVGRVQLHGKCRLAIPYNHIKYGRGLLIIDENTFKLIGTEHVAQLYPSEISKPESAFPRMTVHWASDSNRSNTSDVRYVLRWETLPANRDEKPNGTIPPPSMLRLYGLSGKRSVE